jgi:putative aminopeptidase FrvX
MNQSERNNIRAMLEYRRPARSKTEQDFIARYIDTIPGVYADRYGNRILISEGSKVMISCHTDTVHRMGGKQRVNITNAGMVTLARRERESNCLGADDTAGIYAALRMIQAGVKATFVFHRDEESGGRGSAWLAREYPNWIAKFDVCLALDRRGTQDVIVSQSWGKCASDEFASGLAEQLGMDHKAADGIFTDSASYVDLIPECSNLSIGYQNEHTQYETLDLEYLDRVIDRLIAVNWDDVPVCREPGDNGCTGFHWGYSCLDASYDGLCDYCGEHCKADETQLTPEGYEVCIACWEQDQSYYQYSGEIETGGFYRQ